MSSQRGGGRHLLARLARCDRGQGLAEYGILLLVLCLAAAMGSIAVEGSVEALWGAPSSTLAAVAESADATEGSPLARSGILREDVSPDLKLVHAGSRSAAGARPSIVAPGDAAPSL
jgi:hypothetical protein